MKIIIFVCTFFCYTISFAQRTDSSIKKDKIGVTVSMYGTSDIIEFNPNLQNAGFSSSRIYTLGINYIHSINYRLDFETGLELSGFKINVLPGGILYSADQYGLITTSRNLELISIPFSIRTNLSKYFYFNGGILIDLDFSNLTKSTDTTDEDLKFIPDSQTGIGAFAGLGLKYDFKPGWEITLNPFAKIHSMVSFTTWDHVQRLVETGCRFSITIPLK